MMKKILYFLAISAIAAPVIGQDISDEALLSSMHSIYFQGGEAYRYAREGKIKLPGTAIEYIKKTGIPDFISGSQMCIYQQSLPGLWRGPK